jgi:type IV secretory pathway ATPase VirB11/archaellum biosynthesis ATPase
MTAMDGGERPLDIFPLPGDVNRGRLMQETWRAFVAEMAGVVAVTLAGGCTPPEIAYALGEIVHNYFRTRGVTLTSYELRRFVADLLARRITRHDGRREQEADGPLVRFAAEPVVGESSWTGAEAAAPSPAVSDNAFASPPSQLVTMMPRDADAAQLSQIVAEVRATLGGDPMGLPRKVVVDAIGAVLDAQPEGQAATRHAPTRLAFVRLALGELCGLGPIDRLWADRSIRAVFVNGPASIQLERDGVIEPSHERFRDRSHLDEVVARLVGRPAAPTVTVRLRDGSEGVVVLAPAAPSGPVLALRRGEPGQATLERLVAGGKLGQPMADLLRIATRCRLNVLLVGPERTGKTALLAALARDLGDARVVTVARHREFRGPSPSRVELNVSPQAPFATLLMAAAQLRADHLLVDSPQPADTPALAALLSQGLRGLVAGGEPQAMAAVPRAAVDLLVNVGRHAGSFILVSMEDGVGAPIFVHGRDGRFHRRTTTPSFAATVQERGYGEALARVLR